MIINGFINIKKVWIFSNFLFFLLSVNGCIKDNPRNFLISGHTMGTTYSVKIYDSLDNFKLTTLSNNIEILLDSLNNIFSTYIDTSEISKINNNLSTNISEDFRYVFNKSKYYNILSNGAFDITVHPLVQLWGFGNRTSKYIPPDTHTVSTILNNIGMQYVDIVSDKIIKEKMGLELDMSAIAKGYAVDQIWKLLFFNNIKNCMVEIGGEIRCSGTKINERWSIGIQNPNGGVKQTIYPENMSVATSGNYNNYFLHEGTNYSHTINPKTGYPVNHSLVSATVIANNCLDADALATTLMVLGVEFAINLIELLDDVECYLIETKNENYFTEYRSTGFSKYEN